MVLLLWLAAHWAMISSVVASVLFLFGLLKGWTRLVTFVTGIGQRFAAAEQNIHLISTNHLTHIQETSHATVIELQKLNVSLESMSESIAEANRYTRLLIGQKLDEK